MCTFEIVFVIVITIVFGYYPDDSPAEASSSNFTFFANNKVCSDNKEYGPPRQATVVFH